MKIRVCLFLLLGGCATVPEGHHVMEEMVKHDKEKIPKIKIKSKPSYVRVYGYPQIISEDKIIEETSFLLGIDGEEIPLKQLLEESVK